MAFPTIPTVAAGSLLFVNQLNTTATRTFPDFSGLTFAAGDRLIAIVIGYQSSTTDAQFSGWSHGFTERHDTGTSTTLAVGVAEKIAVGDETGTLTVTQAATITGDASMILMAIPGAHASTVIEVSPRVSGTGAAADPAAFNPAGWDVEDTLWISVVGSGMTSGTGSWTATGTAAPTNYTDRVDTNATDTSTVGDVEAAVAFRQLAAASEDVATAGVDVSNARNAAVVIAVRPSASVDHTRTVTDPLGLVDSAAQAVSGERSQTDPLGLADEGTAELTRPVGSSLGLADSGTAELTRPFDSLGLTDDVTYDLTGGAIERTQTDPLGLVDTANQVLDALRAQTDPLGLTDSQTFVQDYRFEVTDPVDLTDDISHQGVAERSEIDLLGLADSVTGASVYQRSQTDALGLTDAVSYDQQGAGEVVITDPLGLSDAVAVSGSKSLTETDPLGLTDSVQAGLLIEVSITDLIAAVDAAAIAGGYQIAVTDSQGLVDAISRSIEFFRTHDDALGLADTALAEGVDQPVWFVEGAGTAGTGVESASALSGLIERI